MLICLDFVTY